MSIPASLSAALEARYPDTLGHARRVTALAEAVALRLRWSESRLAALRLGAPLHDVGKLAVAADVLQKPGRLDRAELAQIRRHPTAGATLLERLPGLRPALPYVLYHHERWDGSGYPSGKGGTEIPLEARILALADAFDAMTSDRPYRAALPVHEALAEIGRCAGSQFDPRLAQAFLEVWREGLVAA